MDIRAICLGFGNLGKITTVPYILFTLLTNLEPMDLRVLGVNPLRGLPDGPMGREEGERDGGLQGVTGDKDKLSIVLCNILLFGSEASTLSSSFFILLR